MNFSVEEEERFINIVAKHSILYDAAHPEYRNILVKDNIWKKIGKELNKSSDDCKKKWKFIRDAYHRYKKKNILGTGSAAPKNAKDKRHKQLLLLDGVSQHRSGGSNVTESPQGSENEENADDEKEESEAEEAELNKDLQNTENEKNGEEELLELEEKKRAMPEKDNIEEKAIKKRQKRTNTDDQVLKLWKERDSRRQDLLKTMVNKKDDDVALFCGHIGEVLKSLPPLFKAQAKKQLGIILAEYEIMAAGSTSYPNLASANSINTNIASRTSSAMSQYSTILSPSSEGSSHAMPGSNDVTQLSYRYQYGFPIHTNIPTDTNIPQYNTKSSNDSNASHISSSAKGDRAMPGSSNDTQLSDFSIPSENQEYHNM